MTTGSGPVAGPALDTLRADTVEAIGEVMRRHGEWIMADFPRHLNVGDSLIWLGERKIAARVGARCVAAFDKHSFSGRGLKRRLPDAPVLIHGGGNFGDLYPSHHRLRKRILAHFRGRPIVQLGQSMNFRDPAELAETQRLIAGHGDVTLLVRDRASLAFAQQHFDAEVRLVPDAAFALWPLRRPAAEAGSLRWQARVDKEGIEGLAGGAETFDWLEQPELRTERLRLQALELALTVAAGPLGPLPALTANPVRVYDRYAHLNLQRGVRLIGAADVFVTDRLHGHVLATLLGVRHVVIGDRYGKIANLWETWSGQLGVGVWADDAAQARSLAEQLRS